MNHRPIFLDANLLSIFSEIGRLELLLTLLSAHDLHVSPAILRELSMAVKRGHAHIQVVLDLINVDGPIKVTAPSTFESSNLTNLPSWMAMGEAECIVVCRSRGWVFASFDRKAINYCIREKILYLTLNAILTAFWKFHMIPQVKYIRLSKSLNKVVGIYVTKQKFLDKIKDKFSPKVIYILPGTTTLPPAPFSAAAPHPVPASWTGSQRSYPTHPLSNGRPQRRPVRCR